MLKAPYAPLVPSPFDEDHRTLSLSAGTRRGPYEVLALLGEGGMGEVCRAHDSKLNRDVAIKILLPAVATDPDRLARFSREARVLASLNHPTIAAIYGLEDAPSTSSGLQPRCRPFRAVSAQSGMS